MRSSGASNAARNPAEIASTVGEATAESGGFGYDRISSRPAYPGRCPSLGPRRRTGSAIGVRRSAGWSTRYGPCRPDVPYGVVDPCAEETREREASTAEFLSDVETLRKRAREHLERVR